MFGRCFNRLFLPLAPSFLRCLLLPPLLKKLTMSTSSQHYLIAALQFPSASPTSSLFPKRLVPSLGCHHHIVAPTPHALRSPPRGWSTTRCPSECHVRLDLLDPCCPTHHRVLPHIHVRLCFRLHCLFSLLSDHLCPRIGQGLEHLM
jgi:hypothetical protein